MTIETLIPELVSMMRRAALEMDEIERKGTCCCPDACYTCQLFNYVKGKYEAWECILGMVAPKHELMRS